MILFDKSNCVDICLKNTNKYVALAVADMQRDFQRRSLSCLKPQIIKEESNCCIVIERNKTDCCDPIADEGFVIRSKGSKIVITADGYLGTMWGIYTFCEQYLGIDPCYLFNDFETEKVEALEVGEIYIKENPKSFQFRGIFINDEDLLTGWKNGGGIRYVDFPWYYLTVEENVMNMVVETVLRLKLNLVIPASLLDIDNPPERLLADCVAKRGIYLSQHHIEPLGLSSFTFANYCRKYNKTGEFSYIKNPEVIEKAWEFYAGKWAEYDNVVWQIGLRGNGDRPVWQEARPTEAELERYGSFISKAYAKQKEIVVKATGGKAKYFTSTLWMEGSELTEKGFLKFPENTIVVFADAGLNQMYGNEYYTVPRNKTGKYGIYYHLQFFTSGPHLAPQTGIDKLYYNMKLAYENGDNAYCILNSSNIREFVFELKAYSEMQWDINSFSKHSYLDAYCDRFGFFAEEIKMLITQYYNRLPWLDEKYLSEHCQNQLFNFYEGNDLKDAKNYILKEGDILEHGQKIINCFHKKLSWGICEKYYEVLKLTIPQYQDLCRNFEALAEKLPEPLKKNIQVKWLLFAKTLLYIYEWYVALFEAKKYCDLYQSEEMKKTLNNACESLEKYLNYRKCAEYGIFENWYRGDLKMNIKQILYDTRRLLGQTPNYD
ncbi:MAG: glycosyl hydrolase 115 family protein [Clostridia bacterium]|nr:glycosyl hydrolase 115 family protein [Clostridia bacterium]